MAKKKRREEFCATQRVVSPETQEAIDISLEIVRVIEEDVQERAKIKNADYFESCMDKAKAIGETITRTNSVSEGQRKALENTLEGIRKWVHDDD